MKKKFEVDIYHFEFLKSYKIEKYLKVYEYGVRPKQLRLDKLIGVIEEIYESRF